MTTKCTFGYGIGEMVQCMHITLGRISHICFIWYVTRISTTSTLAAATADTASVYTTGALFFLYVMGIGFPFCRRTYQSFGSLLSLLFRLLSQNLDIRWITVSLTKFRCYFSMTSTMIPLCSIFCYKSFKP